MSILHPVLHGKAPERAAISARVSCNLSRKASIEDQNRNCYDYAEKSGWVVLPEYVRADESKTGRTRHNRDGLEYLLKAAFLKPRPFDVLLVDEASRLARKLKDILAIADELKFAGVKLVLVNLRLQSDDPNFQSLLTLHGMVDEQNSERSRERVLRGQKGRVLEGFSSGSLAFGYRRRKVPRPGVAKPELHADFQGPIWEEEADQAATVRRIMEMFAGGLSTWQICCKLEAKKVPAARKPRIGPDRTVWNQNLIKRILQNPKYVGKIIWNKTSQVIDPRNGKIVTLKNAIREDRLAAQLVHYLATNLLRPETMKYLVAAVSDELQHYLKGAVKDRESSRDALVRRVAEHEAGIRRLMEYILDPQNKHSAALADQLAQTEAELAQARIDLSLVSAPKELVSTNFDLGKLVSNNVQNLLDVLKQDVPKARQVLQRLVKKLTLHPTDTPNGPGYMVYGEIDLFRPPDNPSGGVLLDRSYIRTVQQYTDNLYRFVGEILYVRGGVSPDPLVEPLKALFNRSPDLLHTPLTATQWAKHLKTLDGCHRQFLDRFDGHVLTKDFRNGGDRLRSELGMTDFTYCDVHYYMFARCGEEQQKGQQLPLAA